MAATKKSLTEAQIAKLRSMAKDGASRRAIAREIRCSQWTVSKYAGGTSPQSAKLAPVTEDEKAMFLHLAKRGMTCAQISNTTGRSTRTISRYVPAETFTHPASVNRMQYLEAYRRTMAERAEGRCVNHGKHLKLIVAANPRGFAWYPDKALVRLYALERPIPRSEFHKGQGRAA